MPQKTANRNYLDVMMENLENARVGGPSFADATAVSAMVKAAWNEEALRKLVGLLVRKGVLTQEEWDGLDKSLGETMTEMSNAAEEKYPVIAKASKNEKPR
ncbi:MAG: hypothetical protein ACXVI3_06160 [Halobacteriota archaeon]